MNKRIKNLKNKKGLKISKDCLKINSIFTIWIDSEQRNFMQPHLLRADRIEYMHDRGENDLFGKIFDHHLMFYFKKELVFKVWLPNNSKDKPYKDIIEALNKSGFSRGKERSIRVKISPIC